jgi:hypothetical protein
MRNHTLILAVVLVSIIVFSCGARYGMDPIDDGNGNPNGVGPYVNQGRVLYSRVEGAIVASYAVKPDGTGQLRLPIGGLFHAPSRGGAIAYVTLDSTLQQQFIYVSRFDSGVIARVGPADTVDLTRAQIFPVLSPDRLLVAYSCSYRANSVIHLVGSDGLNDRVLVENAAPFVIPSFSPDGTRIAFAATDGFIYAIDVTAGRVSPANTLPVSLSWSPDGTQLCFARTGALGIDICTVGVNSGAVSVVLSDPSLTGHGHPTWSPTGEWIACEHTGGIWLVKPDRSDSVNLASAFDMLDQYPQWSGDGTKVLFARSTLTDIGTIDCWCADLASAPRTSVKIAAGLSLFNGMAMWER